MILGNCSEVSAYDGIAAPWQPLVVFIVSDVGVLVDEVVGVDTHLVDLLRRRAADAVLVLHLLPVVLAFLFKRLALGQVKTVEADDSVCINEDGASLCWVNRLGLETCRIDLFLGLGLKATVWSLLLAEHLLIWFLFYWNLVILSHDV